jgi:hypothetical protein
MLMVLIPSMVFSTKHTTPGVNAFVATRRFHDKNGHTIYLFDISTYVQIHNIYFLTHKILYTVMLFFEVFRFPVLINDCLIVSLPLYLSIFVLLV